MITSLIEMLELPNFRYMTTLHYNLNHVIKFFIDKSYDVITFINVFINVFILRRSRIANFTDIIKTATMFSKTTF